MASSVLFTFVDHAASLCARSPGDVARACIADRGQSAQGKSGRKVAIHGCDAGVVHVHDHFRTENAQTLVILIEAHVGEAEFVGLLLHDLEIAPIGRRAALR